MLTCEISFMNCLLNSTGLEQFAYWGKGIIN